MIDQERLGLYAVLAYIALLYLIEMEFDVWPDFPAILAYFSGTDDD